MVSVLGSIANRIRTERVARGLTQTELGDLSGVSINFISQLEMGKKTVRMNCVLRVLDTLGLTLKVDYSKNR